MTSGDTPGGWPVPSESAEPTPSSSGVPAGAPTARATLPAPAAVPAAVVAPQPIPPSPPAQPQLPEAAQPRYGQPYPAQPYPYSALPYSATPYPAPVWVPGAPPAPARASRVTVMALVVALVVALAGVGGLTAYAGLAGVFSARPTWRATVPQDPPPASDAPASAWTAWARRSVSDTVKDQARALLAGDEAGFEAIADPSDEKLGNDLRRRFEVLRALKPGAWTQTVGEFNSSTARSWSAEIKISYCFGDSTCVPADLSETSRWSVRNDRVVLVALNASGGDQQGPRPWENDELTVAQGERVVVAATKSNVWRLPDAVKSADRAALVADTFARWRPKPNRYVIFLAAEQDWDHWYGGHEPQWAAAWAVQVGDNVTEVMVHTDSVLQRDLENLLTHELTHVTSLAGEGGDSKAWWLIEGIAEYATMVNKPLTAYDGLAPTRDFVRRDWDGHPDVNPPSSRASLAEAAARYGVAFLAVRRIAEKYTQDKMLDFFGRVVHDGASLDAAARAALGVSWATASADCASAIRKSLV